MTEEENQKQLLLAECNELAQKIIALPTNEFIYLCKTIDERMACCHATIGDTTCTDASTNTADTLDTTESTEQDLLRRRVPVATSENNQATSSSATIASDTVQACIEEEDSLSLIVAQVMAAIVLIIVFWFGLLYSKSSVIIPKFVCVFAAIEVCITVVVASIPSFLSLSYALIPITLLTSLEYAKEKDVESLLYIFLLCNLSDIIQSVINNFIGRIKVFPRFTNKTLEGYALAIAGHLMYVKFSIQSKKMMHLYVYTTLWVILGMIGSVFSNYAKSKMNRKKWSKAFAFHGGVNDVFASWMLPSILHLCLARFVEAF